MKNVSTKFSALALLLAITIVGGGAVSANNAIKYSELTDDQIQVLKEAKELKENGNHEAAKALLDEAGIKPPKHRFGKFKNSLTEEQQAVLEEARELKEAGDQDGARALLDETGIKPPHKGRHQNEEEHAERREAIKAAIETGDFNALQEAVGDSPFGQQVTKENFSQIQKIHELREAGDKEGARELAEELGLERPKPHRFFRNEK